MRNYSCNRVCTTEGSHNRKTNHTLSEFGTLKRRFRTTEESHNRRINSINQTISQSISQASVQSINQSYSIFPSPELPAYWNLCRACMHYAGNVGSFPWRVSLSKALYHSWFMHGQGCKWWPISRNWLCQWFQTLNRSFTFACTCCRVKML